MREEPCAPTRCRVFVHLYIHHRAGQGTSVHRRCAKKVEHHAEACHKLSTIFVGKVPIATGQENLRLLIAACLSCFPHTPEGWTVKTMSVAFHHLRVLIDVSHQSPLESQRRTSFAPLLHF